MVSMCYPSDSGAGDKPAESSDTPHEVLHENGVAFSAREDCKHQANLAFEKYVPILSVIRFSGGRCVIKTSGNIWQSYINVGHATFLSLTDTTIIIAWLSW